MRSKLEVLDKCFSAHNSHDMHEARRIRQEWLEEHPDDMDDPVNDEQMQMMECAVHEFEIRHGMAG